MQVGANEQVYGFSGFTLDLAKGVLQKGGQSAFLRPKALALLSHLARNPGRVVPKSELMETVWPGIYVTEDSLTQSIREIRKVLGDEEQKLIRTISRRGYMLAADAGSVDDRSSQPVVAVLRFRNETGDEGQAPLIDGIAESIINGLGRFGRVTVLAPHSSFSIPLERRAEARARIGADYLVEGSVRRSGQTLRVAVSLIDASSLAQLWSDRYDAEGSAIFDVQEDIAERVIYRLVARLDEAGISRALRKPATSLDAYELMLRGLALLNANTPDDFKAGSTLLEAAIAKDPAYGLAHAYLAFAKTMHAGFGRAPPGALAEALDVAVRALKLAPDEPAVYRVISFIQMYRGDHAAAEHHLWRSLELNPYDAESVEQMGYLQTLRGKPLDGLAWMDRAVRLNPIHPQWYEHDRAFALHSLGDYRAAAAAIELTPLLPAWMRTWLAACYAQMGDIETARFHAAQITETDPQFSAISFARGNGAAFEHAADNQHFAEGVFMALGLPMDS